MRGRYESSIQSTACSVCNNRLLLQHTLLIKPPFLKSDDNNKIEIYGPVQFSELAGFERVFLSFALLKMFQYYSTQRAYPKGETADKAHSEFAYQEDFIVQ